MARVHTPAFSPDMPRLAIQNAASDTSVTKACIGISGEVISRPMTDEDRRRYGMPNMVICPVCGRLLPQTRQYFYLSGNKRFRNTCIDCLTRKEAPPKVETRICKKCGLELPLTPEHWFFRGDKPEGHTCKACRSAAMKKSRENKANKQPSHDKWSEPATADNAPENPGQPSDDVAAYLPKPQPATINKEFDACFDAPCAKEPKPAPISTVNHPPHYTASGIKCIDAIMAATYGMDGIRMVCTAGAIQALWRQGSIEDLHMAAWYIKQLIKSQEENAC